MYIIITFVNIAFEKTQKYKLGTIQDNFYKFVDIVYRRLIFQFKRRTLVNYYYIFVISNVSLLTLRRAKSLRRFCSIVVRKDDKIRAQN